MYENVIVQITTEKDKFGGVLLFSTVRAILFYFRKV